MSAARVPPRLVLASTSRYRRELLARLGIPFETLPPDIDERIDPGELPREAALRLAQGKAVAVARRLAGSLVIGSDQVASLEGRCMGKPGTHEAAVAQLRAMRGRCVVFHTAVSVIDADSGRLQVGDVPTVVRCRDYTDDEIEAYLRAARPYDCAGSARVESLGIAMLDSVSSTDPTALIGLPLVRLAAMLRREGCRIPAW